MCDDPIHQALDFARSFSLAVDTSDNGAGAVLMQADDQEIDHPVAYFSKKLNCHQNNSSTIEIEALALNLVIQHFEIYI